MINDEQEVHNKKRTQLMAASRTLGATIVSSLNVDNFGKSPLRRREMLVALCTTSGNVGTGRSIGCNVRALELKIQLTSNLANNAENNSVIASFVMVDAKPPPITFASFLLFESMNMHIDSKLLLFKNFEPPKYYLEYKFVGSQTGSR